MLTLIGVTPSMSIKFCWIWQEASIEIRDDLKLYAVHSFWYAIQYSILYIFMYWILLVWKCKLKKTIFVLTILFFFLLSENLLFAALNSREFGVFSKLHLIMYESNVLIIFASFPKVGLRLVGCYYIWRNST